MLTSAYFHVVEDVENALERITQMTHEDKQEDLQKLLAALLSDEQDFRFSFFNTSLIGSQLRFPLVFPYVLSCKATPRSTCPSSMPMHLHRKQSTNCDSFIEKKEFLNNFGSLSRFKRFVMGMRFSRKI